MKVEKMEKKYMERLLGKYCKIVTKEPGEERASVVTGILEDVDYKDGFVLINSKQGLGCLRINTIIAIKPARNREINSEKKKCIKEERAMVGIGTLIVFIAMVLIAAVAASVLITTSEVYQQRARSVGSQTIKEVSTGFFIDDITGYTNVNKTLVEYLALSVKPRAGSSDIDLSLLTVTVLYENLSVLTLDESLVVKVNTDNKSVFETPISSGSSYTILDNTTSIKFGVIAIHDPDNTVINTSGMNSGDRVFIIVNLSAILTGDGGLPTRQRISGKIQPETGSPAVYDLTAPAVYSMRIVDLY
jgi:flagellin FlaB